MSTNHHVPHTYHADLTSVEVNRPLSELDSAIETVITTGSGASTTLTAQAAAGQASLTVASSAGFTIGDPIYLGTGAMFESRIIATVPGGGVTITVTVNLSNTYASGKPVSKSPVEIVAARGSSTTLGARLGIIARGVINAREYGATGDGTTDDTAAIQAALTAGGATGEVNIPAGTYSISAALALVSGQRITAGPGAALKRANAMATTVMLGGTDLSDVSISGLALIGNSASAGEDASGSGAINGARATRWRITDVRVTDLRGTERSVQLAGAVDCVISGCHFEDVGYGVLIGLWANSADPCTDNIVTGCTFRNVDLNGVFLTGSIASTASTAQPAGNVVIGNAFYGCGDTAIESGIGCIGTVIEGNTITGGAGAYVGLAGILVRDNNNAIITGNTVASVTGATGWGIGVVYAFDVNQDIVVGPNVVQACVRGLYVSNCIAISVTGGAYHDNSDSGVRLETVSDFSVAGVQSFRNGDSGFLFAANTVRGVVSGCVARDNTVDGFLLQHAACNEVSFDGCAGYDSRAGGARTQDVGLNVYAGTSIWQHGGRFYNNVAYDVANGIAAEFHSNPMT